MIEFQEVVFYLKVYIGISGTLNQMEYQIVVFRK